MANALSFDGSAPATVENFIWEIGNFPTNPANNGGIGAVEFYVMTTAPNQALFTSALQLTLSVKQIGSLGLVIWLDANGYVNLQGTATNELSNVSESVNYAGNVAVTDGKWHLVSLYCDGQDVYQYIDGVGVQMTSASSDALGAASDEKSVGLGTWSGSLAFGADAYNPTPVAPAFTGQLTEIRLWSGGTPGFVLAPAFSLNIGVPVSVSAPNLQAYWSFWTNQANQLQDLVNQVPLMLGSATVATGLPQYYDDISEVTCNTPMQAFNPFTTGTQGAAFMWILTRIDLTGYTPQSFRQIYLDQSYGGLFGGWGQTVAELAYPQGSTVFTQSDFSVVQTALAAELRGASVVWSVATVAFQSNVLLGNQYSMAASDVYTTLYDSSIVSLTQTETSDAGLVVDIVAAAASLIPDVGTAIAAGIKIAWAIVGFTQQAPQSVVKFEPILAVEAQASDLVSMVNQAIAKLNTLTSASLGIILQDYGMLSTVAQRVNDGTGFVFGSNLSDGSTLATQILDAAYNAAVLQFGQTLLVSAFPMYVWYMNQYGEFTVTVNFVQNSQMFYYGWGEGPYPLWKPGNEADFSFGGQLIVGYCQPNGQNGWPNYCSLSIPAQDLIANAASELGNQSVSLQELVSWNWTQVENPQDCPA